MALAAPVPEVLFPKALSVARLGWEADPIESNGLRLEGCGAEP